MCKSVAFFECFHEISLFGAHFTRKNIPSDILHCQVLENAGTEDGTVRKRTRAVHWRPTPRLIRRWALQRSQKHRNGLSISPMPRSGTWTLRGRYRLRVLLTADRGGQDYLCLLLSLSFKPGGNCPKAQRLVNSHREMRGIAVSAFVNFVVVKVFGGARLLHIACRVSADSSKRSRLAINQTRTRLMIFWIGLPECVFVGCRWAPENGLIG
ncbi:hypothetical protein Ddc_06939 [Ditylenchus destructor]|nr:hypothetical protein Ddc_06939 [Ditylenchus destructor]